MRGSRRTVTLPTSLGKKAGKWQECELYFSHAPWGWKNSVRHTNDVLQARANVKNNKYKDVYGLVTRRLHLPSKVCLVRSTLIFFGFSGVLAGQQAVAVVL